jgi:hypothetical protein
MAVVSRTCPRYIMIISMITPRLGNNLFNTEIHDPGYIFLHMRYLADQQVT